MTPAEQGRKQLAVWKAAHRTCGSGCGCGKCRECNLILPCPTARLIAAVEEALSQCLPSECQHEGACGPDAIFAKLAEER